MESEYIQDYLNTIPNSMYNKTSIQNIRRSLLVDPLSTQQSSFIPFLKERDGMNKILTLNIPEKQEIRSNADGEFLFGSTPKLRLRKKVRTRQVNPIYPSVGSYNLNNRWIKKTFSSKKIVFSKINNEIPAACLAENSEIFRKTQVVKEENKAKSAPENRRKNKDNRFDEVIERKEMRNVVQRQLGTWNSLKIHGSPEEIKEELKFSQERAAIKKCQIEIKSLLNELKR